MTREKLEKLLMRYAPLGVEHSKNGALLIGKAPHIAELAWLNTLYLVCQQKRSHSWKCGFNAQFPRHINSF